MKKSKDINVIKFIEWCRFYDPNDIEARISGELIGSCKSLLEIGCGTGRLTAKLSAFSSKVIGVDKDKSLLLACKRIKDVKLVVADALALPFKSSSVDVAIFSWSLSCIREREAALREAKRVLKSGGKILVIDQASNGEYAHIVRNFIRGYGLFNEKIEYEKPLVSVFGNIKRKIGPIDIPYIFQI
jgi:ubiquinone/menaquinone biosynthesis C-methylase UbiE